MLSALLFALQSAPLLATLQDQLNKCATIKLGALRLKCYDGLSQIADPKQKTAFINPPNNFLASELRTKRHESEYSLSIADFVALIKRARLESGKKVSVLGWNKQQQSFTLRIRMKKIVSILFTHIKTKTENVGLLQPVMMDGGNVDPSLFIITIASMTPDL